MADPVDRETSSTAYSTQITLTEATRSVSHDSSGDKDEQNSSTSATQCSIASALRWHGTGVLVTSMNNHSELSALERGKDGALMKVSTLIPQRSPGRDVVWPS